MRWLATLAVILCSGVSHAVTIDWVAVGYPGNADDTRYDTPGYGGVNYAYRMGKHEVTTGQYTNFLNAVAASDTYGLYSSSMWSDEYGCKIERDGNAGSYTYSVAGDRADRPVNYISWGDAARFANWLHNGQPTGAQDLTSTEDGAYYLNGVTSRSGLLAIARESDATCFIPTEDEWYKAAYHKNDGATGNYWDYPTGTNSIPSNDLSNPDQGNNANFYHGDYTVGGPYWTTEVGEFENSESPYGTFDQGGNLWEWNETEVLVGLSRGLRGGFWVHDYHGLHASTRHYIFYPASEDAYVAFRVASIPETVVQGDMNDDGHVNGLDVDGFVNAILYDSFNPYADMTGSDGPNGLDVTPFVAAVIAGGTQPVPEPATLLLVTLGLLGLLCRRRDRR